MVTDKSGTHIHQLTKSDFKILENGKQQRIASFEEITSATDRLTVHADAPGTFSNLHLEGQQPHSVTVIVLDMVNTPFLNQANGREQLIKYLADHLDSTQVLGLMVIGSKGLTVLSGLGTDPACTHRGPEKSKRRELQPWRDFKVEAQAAAATGDEPSGLLGGIPRGASLRRQYFADSSKLTLSKPPTSRGDPSKLRCKLSSPLPGHSPAFREGSLWFG